MTAPGIKPRSSPHEVVILTTRPSHLSSTMRLLNMSTLKLYRCLSRAMQPLFSGMQICTPMFVVRVRSCFFSHQILLRQSYLGLDFLLQVRVISQSGGFLALCARFNKQSYFNIRPLISGVVGENFCAPEFGGPPYSKHVGTHQSTLMPKDQSKKSSPMFCRFSSKVMQPLFCGI